MPRRKAVEDEPVHSDEPKGEALPALEDFVRKLSNVFSSDVGVPEVMPMIEEEEETEEREDSE